MNAPIFTGCIRYVFGVPEVQRPIEGLPKGKVRLRLRNRSFATLYVKDGGLLRKFALVDEGEKWRVGVEVGRNETKRT